jgi:Flp pilus assembly protein TadD
MSDRIAFLTEHLSSRPDDQRARFALAVELERLERWDDAVRELRAYLEAADDEGNAYGRLGHCLRQLGRDEEAREAYRRGVVAATRHGHPTMAAEFEELLEEWD